MLDFSDVCVAADAMIRCQAHLNEAGMHCCIGGVDGGEAIVDPDVVDDHSEIGGADRLSNNLLRLREVLLGDIEFGSGRSLDVDDKLAGVGLGKVGEAEKRIERKADREDNPKHRQNTNWLLKHSLDENFISSKHLLKAMVECSVESRCPYSLSAWCAGL